MYGRKITKAVLKVLGATKRHLVARDLCTYCYGYLLSLTIVISFTSVALGNYRGIQETDWLQNVSKIKK
jgi:hypothetical protein